MHQELSISKRTWLFATGVTLLVQSLFPSGYMPANLQSGWVAMLCPDGLPSAFVRHLNNTNEHHHHHAEHGEASASHGDVGSCQLGGSLDQPIDLQAIDLADLSAPRTSTNSLPEAVQLADKRLQRVRSRAPPLFS